MYTIVLEAKSTKDAHVKTEEMCKRLLANPTKDDFIFQVEKTK